MVAPLKPTTTLLMISAFIALFLNGCEMTEETELKPEIVIANPVNNAEVIRGSEIKITARLKDFSQYLNVHQISLRLGNSVLIEKNSYVPELNYLLQTRDVSGDTHQISAEVLFTDDQPEDKDWNFFSVRDYYDDLYDEYIEEDKSQDGIDTLKATASVTINMTSPSGSSTPMDFSSFPQDTFVMGGDSITIDSFEIGQYEVTNEQYSEFMNSIHVDTTGSYGDIKYIFLTTSTGITYDGSQFVPKTGSDSLPVVNVTWTGAASFCNWMGGRLPTDIEWYYASDTSFTYSGSNTAEDVAWYRENSDGHPHKVGLKDPNKYGIYDMSGNVAEWCQNSYNESSKVFKGGHWQSPLYDLRTSRRYHLPSDGAGNYLGFRVVMPH